MKKVLVLALAVLMTACGQDETVKNNQAEYLDAQKNQVMPSGELTPSETIKALDQKLVNVGKITKSEQIKFSTVAYEYELPDEMKQACNFDPKTPKDDEGFYKEGFCTSINIKLAKVEPRWIEQIVNKTITNDDNPKLLKFKQNVDEFVGEHLMFINEMKDVAKENGEPFESAPSYAWTVVPELIPAHKNLAQVAIAGDVYMGGAHGMPFMEYLMFDMDLQTQIDFSDVIVVDRASDFHELAYAGFKEYLKDELQITTKKDIQEYEQTWQFEMTENVYFGKNGVVLVYQPYEMGGFAQGFVEIVVPYDKLQGIIQEEYLPKQTAKTANQESVSQESVSQKAEQASQADKS
ncbi:DUF3298 domain-containing protein [Moraxella sp. K127]|uniref:RsiV family protein n=1 Tax=Moraxella sp. K127 TaxID=2780079 RepID=UPI0018801FAC|nr:RsiV family protein [Moraxella sp. K127]MBE9589747.1 DUF3298 domain-containing protein [Moraxella sp. K127]